MYSKHTRPIALFTAIIVLFAGLISCATQALTGQAPAGPAQEAETGRWVGHFPAERLHLIGQVPPGALAWQSVETRFPAISYDFPEFLVGIWEHTYGDIFHLINVEDEDIGYSISGWTPSYGWAGPFVAVYYIDDQNPEAGGLVFAEFAHHPNWCLTPSDTETYPISAFYYEKVESNIYYMMNLAKKLPAPDPDFPGYEYGQPMYETVEDALYELINQGELPGMLISWVEYKRQ